MYDKRNKVCVSSLESMKKDFADVITPEIRVNTKLKEAPQDAKNIFDYDAASRGSEDYNILVGNILGMETTLYQPLVKKSRRQVESATIEEKPLVQEAHL